MEALLFIIGALVALYLLSVLIYLVIVLICKFSGKNNYDLKSKGEINKNKQVKFNEPAKNLSKPTFPCVKNTEVKGTFYRSRLDISAARFLEVGDRLILVPELENAYDTNAVKICTVKGAHIGYVQSDLSKFVKDNLSHVSDCRVTKISKHEIPFINASIHFSSIECQQPEFIPKRFQVSAEDELINLVSTEKFDSLDVFDKKITVKEINLQVEGIYERDVEIIKKTKSLKKGDKVNLKKAVRNEYLPDRLDVYTEDGTLIGYICQLDKEHLFELYEKIVNASVISPIKGYNTETITISVILSEDENYSSLIHIGCGPYPQLRYADSIKREDTGTALEIALPIAEKEKGINAKFLCCQCYRLIKDYESEKEMIIRIINRIDSISDEEISPIDYYVMKKRVPEILKRLNTVESRIQSKLKKRK